MVLVQVLPSSPLFSDKATGRMRNMPTLRASFSWARLTASLSHANAQMAIHNASSVPIKMRETPSNLRIEAKSFYGYKIPVGQLSACHSALSSPRLVAATIIYGWFDFLRSGMKSVDLSSTTSRKLQSWPPAFVGIGNQQIKICDVRGAASNRPFVLLRN